MKKILLLLALFPFLHATSYHADYVSCKQDEIILKMQKEEVQVSLFNIKIKDETGWKQTCDLLQEAKKISVEIDPSSAVQEPIPVYIFVDETLLQETLLKDDQAFIQIKNPEYTYASQMEAATHTKSVMAKPKAKEEPRSHAKNAPIFFGILCIIWCVFLYYFWHKKKQKKV